MSDVLTPRLYRLDRQPAGAALAAGAAVLEFPELPQDTTAVIEMVTVAGAGIGGADVTLYRNEPRPEHFMGTAEVPAGAPGASFVEPHPWLYGGERLVIVVAGATGERVSANVWQRLYRDGWTEADPVYRVRSVDPAPAPAAPAPATAAEPA